MPLTFSLPNANPTALRVWVLSLRVFIFLVCVLAVTMPVTFLSEALVGH